MTTHELARRLLELPDLPVYTRNQTYDETTWEEAGILEQTDMVRIGDASYPVGYLEARLATSAPFKALVIL